MNIAVAISLAASAINLSTAALFLSVARAREWRIARLLAVIAFTGSCYNATGIVLATAGLSDSAYLAAGRIAYLAGTLHCVAWLVNAGGGSLRRLPLSTRYLASAALLGGVFFAATGLGLEPRVDVIDIPWAGVAYHYAQVNLAGSVYGLLVPGLLILAFVHFVARFRRGERSLRWLLAGFVVFFACSLEEVLVANRIVKFLSLADLGITAFILPLTAGVLRQIVLDSHRLQELSGRLTEQRDDAYHALVDSEQRFRSFFENSTVGLYRTSPAGLVLMMNPALLQLLGSPSFAALADRELARTGLAGDASATGLEREITRPDGSVLSVREICRAVRDDHGAVLFFDGIVEDITARKQAEDERAKLLERLAQAQKMESVGRLAGGVAHDFNNLLTVINGYSRLLLDGLPPVDSAHARVRQINDAGEKAAALTRQLLAFSRKQLLQPRVLDLNGVVAGMRSILERLMGDDVQVTLTLAPVAPVVHADPHQLEQVVMNLAANARDAMPDGGRLLIETSLDGEGRFAVMSITDNGVGMDEPTRQHIFEPFFTTKGPGRGTGLGLSMVQGIVAQSGGYLNVVGAPGRGTAFHIYLPALAGLNPAADPLPPEPPAGGVETILVVEDQAEVRLFIAAVLGGYDYRVLQAAGGLEALSILKEHQHPVDLVLTDLVMPQMSGPEFVQRMRAAGFGIPCLFMSGYSGDVTLHRGLPDDDAHFIQKPFRPEALAAKVRALLGPSNRGTRILVADDEDSVRSFLRTVLESGGYTVVEAVDGRQAYAQALSQDVDLVITDLVMPEQEGIETICALRRDRPGLGIIAISGAFNGQFLELAKPLGADAVLGKPLSVSLLLSKVDEVLRRRPHAARQGR